MSRVHAVLLAALCALPQAASAAEATRIASSFEDEDPFDLFIDVGFERVQRRMLISRERHTGTEVGLIQELRYTGVDTRLNIDMSVGLWHDVEFTFGLPIDFADNEVWRFAQVAEGNSTITNNCLQANGELLDPSCPSTGAGALPLFPITQANGAQAFRGGLGNLRFGIAYAPFNQRKDNTKPMWVVGLDYEAPTATRNDPFVLTSADARGAIGDRHHKYTFWTAFSRRMGIADPYFRAYYTLPYRGPGWVSNCEHRDPSVLSYPENCDGANAGERRSLREMTGTRLPVRFGMAFGSEFVVYNMPEKHQRIAFDLRALADYVGEGRYYNELSGVLRKMLWTTDYMKFGGQLGVNALASDYVSVRATASLLYNTDHYLTDEPFRGFERGPNGQLTGTNDVNVDPTGDTSGINPTYDFRYDEPTRRFVATEINEFRLDITATFAF